MTWDPQQDGDSLLCHLEILQDNSIPENAEILSSYFNNSESEVITGKFQTEALMYWPSDSEVNALRPRFEVSNNNTNNNNNLFTP